jgi:hypothetical protein
MSEVELREREAVLLFSVSLHLRCCNAIEEMHELFCCLGRRVALRELPNVLPQHGFCSGSYGIHRDGFKFNNASTFGHEENTTKPLDRADTSQL